MGPKACNYSQYLALALVHNDFEQYGLELNNSVQQQDVEVHDHTLVQSLWTYLEPSEAHSSQSLHLSIHVLSIVELLIQLIPTHLVLTETRIGSGYLTGEMSSIPVITSSAHLYHLYSTVMSEKIATLVFAILRNDP